jgi:4'-phosphopantetheinyl transferase
MRQLELAGREVHLWAVRLEASESTVAEVSAWLSPDEIARAGRFRFDKHRRAYVLGRALLRALVASYLRATPAEPKFVYGPKGKPALAGAGGQLDFNVSNSGDLAVYTFTLGCEIGVDVEHKRRMVDMEAVARRFFASGEVAELMNLPEADRHEGFFNCWTRKEAYIKAIGDGLSVPLGSFEVTLQPDAPARMVSLNGSTAAADCWTLHAFTPAPEYVGAIAYRDRERPVTVQPLATVDELLERLKGSD